MTTINHRLSLRSILLALCIIVALTLSINSVQAGETPLQRADSAYNQGRYTEAVEIYDSLANTNVASWQLYSNLGNALYQAHMPGRAVVAYERSLRLNPRNEQTRNNLLMIRGMVNDNNVLLQKGANKSVEPQAASFFESIHNWYAREVSSNVWAIAAVISFLLLLTGVAAYIFCKGVILRKIGFFSAIATLCLTLIFIFFAFSGASAIKERNQCVITVHRAEMKSEPSAEAEACALPLSEGTKLEITERRDDWLRVRLNNDYAGWLPATAVEII